jgi:hypothetical protein
MSFRDVRTWMRERNIWHKDETMALLDFLGCGGKPTLNLGRFGEALLEAEGVEAQQDVLYRWLKAWNPFLCKYVLGALDPESDGRLHSTHELYRLVTSYVYVGEYVTLVNFQNWIRWLVVSGIIKLVGIRWGLSPIAQREVAVLRQIDVDEMLEDEAEEREAREALQDETAAAPEFDSGSQTAKDAPPSDASPPDAVATEKEGSNDRQPVEDLGEEELPDLPPEAPIPEWKPDEPQVDDTSAENESNDVKSASAEELDKPIEQKKTDKTKSATAKKPKKPKKGAAGKKSADKVPPPKSDVAVAVTAPTIVPSGSSDIRELGLDPDQYDYNRGLFLFKMAVSGRILTDGMPAFVANTLIGQLCASHFMDRYFAENLPIEEVLVSHDFFVAQPGLRSALGQVLLDIIHYKAVIRGEQTLCDQLEMASLSGDASAKLATTVFTNQSTLAPQWVVHHMQTLGLWRVSQTE